jgi:hypothetical protein
MGTPSSSTLPCSMLYRVANFRIDTREGSIAGQALRAGLQSWSRMQGAANMVLTRRGPDGIRMSPGSRWDASLKQFRPSYCGFAWPCGFGPDGMPPPCGFFPCGAS